MHDAPDCGQPQSGALPGLLRCEKGLEDPKPGRLIHARSRIGDRQHHISSRTNAREGEDICFGELGNRRQNGERASCWHGIARIDNQVHNHLLELAGIGLDAPRKGTQPSRQANIFPDEPSQEALQPLHDLIENQHLGLQELAAAECQELRRQSCGPLGRIVDQCEIAIGRMLRGDARQEEVAAPDDHGQKVVEVVGDAAG